MTWTDARSERDVRIQKAQDLRKMWINPYAAWFTKKDTLWQIVRDFWPQHIHKVESKAKIEGKNDSQNFRDINDIIAHPQSTIQTAWRLTLFRSHGKLSFGRLMDEHGDIQLMFHRDAVKYGMSWEVKNKLESRTSTAHPKETSFRAPISKDSIDREQTKLYDHFPVKESAKTVERHIGIWIVYDPKTNRYLWMKRHADGVQNFPWWGIEEWEDPVEATKREIQEETWYKNLRFVTELTPYRAHYRHPTKNANYLTKDRAFVFDLVDNEQDDIDEKEMEKHEPQWIKAEDIKDFLSTGWEVPMYDHLTLWDEWKSLQHNLQDNLQSNENKFSLPDNLTPYKLVQKYIDVGDFIGVRGEMFRTHKGELTLFVSEFVLLSKAIRSLGDKYHGIGENKEKAYRQRYLDMIHNRETLERMKLRSKFLRVIRDFYHTHDFLEIETPVLGNSASGAAAAPFITHHNDFDIDMYLRISPETSLKMATVWGLERVFEVAKDFRNEWSDPSHHQEFTMIEHYAAYRTFEDNMRFTEKMFDYIFDQIPELNKIVHVTDKQWVTKQVDFTTPRQRIDYIAQIKKDSGIDVSVYGPEDEGTLRALIKNNWHQREGLDQQATATMIDYLYKKVTRPKIVGPAFIYNYPKTMQPLARQSDDDAGIVEQRQLLVNGRELIKAYSELVDPLQQQANFDEQSWALERGDEEATAWDDDFVKAMEYGMPCQSWRGMGIARILSILTEQSNIRDVILFPLVKPEGHNPSHSLHVPVDAWSKEGTAKEGTKEKPKWSTPSFSDSVVTQAQELAAKYLDNTLQHCEQVWRIMHGFASDLWQDENYWYVVWLLHDVDRDHIDKSAEKHLQGEFVEIVQQLDIHDTEKEQLIHDIRTHYPDGTGVSPDSLVQKYLISVDELSGLIHAYSRMRPTGLEGMKWRSLKKKIKDKKFAAWVDREHVRNCETYLDIPLQEFAMQVVQHMQSHSS